MTVDGDATLEANREAWNRITSGTPRVVDVCRAAEVIPHMSDRMVLHAGPPLGSGAEVTGALRGAVIGACLYEGWARTKAAAIELVDRGEITLASAHDHQAVATYAGGISPSTPVLVVRNERFGNLAFNAFNEGRGKALRYGSHDQDTIARLRWFESVLAPVLRHAIRSSKYIDVLPLISAALHMGDECHSRHKAASALLTNAIAPHVVGAPTSDSAKFETLAWLAKNEIFFLNVTMAASKAIMDAASGIPYCSIVTCVARNGEVSGIRVSGLGSRWFTAPVEPVHARYFDGYGPDDANPDLGDSAIAETFGLGAFAMAAAPALARYMGGTPQEAERLSSPMYDIVYGEHPYLTVPSLNFRGVPSGIDVHRVVRTRIAPITNSGVAHRAGGIGQIGAGYTTVPLECFDAAARALQDSGMR